jgi:hypothetical protein
MLFLFGVRQCDLGPIRVEQRYPSAPKPEKKPPIKMPAEWPFTYIEPDRPGKPETRR